MMQESNVLVVGDIHAKYDLIPKIQDFFYSGKYDRVIFMGDYVDDWDKSPADSHKTLRTLLEWKKKDKDRVILLMGNHDFSEWLGGRFACSGYDYSTNTLCWGLYSECAR